MAVDTTALVGLRGLACLHILVSSKICNLYTISSLFKLFHYVGNMTNGDVDLNGSLQLSLFFLLSGFSLALGYGRLVCHSLSI
jgi:peptidoglycan/LPS O-acetylase OafA/YrhL